jgi:hypothetical protein
MERWDAGQLADLAFTRSVAGQGSVFGTLDNLNLYKDWRNE